MIKYVAERNEQGNKKRHDGKGDGWANAHRHLLDKCYMTDVDVQFGAMVFGRNCGNRLFCEYEYVRGKDEQYADLQRFGLVAMFERKSKIDVARWNESQSTLAFQTWMVRTIGLVQGVEPAFFVVVGESKPLYWEMYRVSLEDGSIEKDPSGIVDAENPWPDVWKQLGLSDIRNQIRDLA